MCREWVGDEEHRTLDMWNGLEELVRVVVLRVGGGGGVRARGARGGGMSLLLKPIFIDFKPAKAKKDSRQHQDAAALASTDSYALHSMRRGLRVWSRQAYSRWLIAAPRGALPVLHQRTSFLHTSSSSSCTSGSSITSTATGGGLGATSRASSCPPSLRRRRPLSLLGVAGRGVRLASSMGGGSSSSYAASSGQGAFVSKYNNNITEEVVEAYLARKLGKATKRVNNTPFKVRGGVGVGGVGSEGNERRVPSSP